MTNRLLPAYCESMNRSSEYRMLPSPRIALQKGVVLPVVLVILVILTALVVTQVRRTTIDQRMAVNAQESVALESAAKAVLGWCEVEIQKSNRGVGNTPRSMVAPLPPLPAAWLDPANWAASSYTPANDMGPALPLLGRISFAQCLIEEATDELEGNVSNNDDRGTGGRDCRWRKYRTTAQVRIPAPDLPAGFRAYFVQGEMRLYSNLACI
jgi:hypothetical protein